MITLGIESTAHTLGVAILKDKEVLANVKDIHTTKKGGLIPFKLGEHHINCFDKVFLNALSESKIEPEMIDLIVYSESPGLGNTLRIGASFARTLAILLGKPLVPVNHCIAHLEIARLRTKAFDPVMLYASGANTQVIAYESGKYRIFGETLDMGVGNFIDSFARELGLGFPGGPLIEELAVGGEFVELPYVVKGMDVSFSGLHTKLKQLIKKKVSEKDLAFSMQEIVFAMLIEVSERAMAHTGKNELVLGGGVACNKRLQEMCRKMCADRNAKFFVPENEFLVDNAAMIAWTGYLMFKSSKDNIISPELAGINPYKRTDDVVINWR
jgi:N6-L-threonylcarbamoyladenine synthase